MPQESTAFKRDYEERAKDQTEAESNAAAALFDNTDAEAAAEEAKAEAKKVTVRPPHQIDDAGLYGRQLLGVLQLHDGP